MIHSSPILFPFLLLAATAATATAADPTPVSLFELYSYGNQEFTFEAAAGEYKLHYNDETDSDSEVWIKKNGRVFDHHAFCCDGSRRMFLSSGGTYQIEFAGLGQFAILLPQLVDDGHLAQVSANRSVSAQVGFAFGRDANENYLCVAAGTPVDVRILTGRFEEEAHVVDATTFQGGPWDLVTAWAVFIKPTTTTWVNTTSSSTPCEPAPQPANSDTPSPGLLVTLAVAAGPALLRVGRRAR